MIVVKTDNNRAMTLAEIEACRQFEQSDRSGQVLWWPLVADGDPAPDCLVLLEGNCRYAVQFLPGLWSAENDLWRRRNTDGPDTPADTPVDNPVEDAWRAAMSIKDRLRRELGFGCYVIPVAVFTDMAPDPDILEDIRGRKVRLLWGQEDLVGRLADLPEGDEVQKQLSPRYIAKDVALLNRRPSPAKAASATEPPESPETASLTIGDGQLVIQHADVVNVYIGGADARDADAGQLLIQHGGVVNVYITVAAAGDRPGAVAGMSPGRAYRYARVFPIFTARRRGIGLGCETRLERSVLGIKHNLPGC